MAEKWLPWIYQYGVGGLFFFITLWIAARNGALRRGNRSDRSLFWALLAGFFAFSAIHGLWIAAVR